MRHAWVGTLAGSGGLSAMDIEHNTAWEIKPERTEWKGWAAAAHLAVCTPALAQPPTQRLAHLPIALRDIERKAEDAGRRRAVV